MDATINIPFAVKLETDSNYFGYVDHPNLHATCYANQNKARNVLKANVAEQVNEALKQVKNYQQRAIGTVQGEVFIIQYRHGSWRYSIVGPGRKFGGSCSSGENFDQTVASAIRHINDAFGGIAWECSL